MSEQNEAKQDLQSHLSNTLARHIPPHEFDRGDLVTIDGYEGVYTIWYIDINQHTTHPFTQFVMYEMKEMPNKSFSPNQVKRWVGEEK